MRIAFVISSLRAGGAERVLVLLAKGLAEQGHQVTVVTIGDPATDFYSLPLTVDRRAVTVRQQSPWPGGMLLRHAKKIVDLRRIVASTDADVAIAFITKTNIQMLLALAGTKIKTIVTEHIDPLEVPCGPTLNSLRRFTYPWANKTVSVSRGIDKYFKWIPDRKKCVIHNPVDYDDVELGKSAECPPIPLPEDPFIVAMGRLARQKGFDLLIQAFLQVRRRFPDWSLLILGEGADRPALEHLIRSRDLTDSVFLPGSVKQPFPLLRKAELFVLSSRFEGFGNVLIEAMACGTPVVSFDCPSGPSEIITDGINGVLVPPRDVDTLADTICNLIADVDCRKRLAANGEVRARDFGLEPIIDQWRQLLDELPTS